MDQDTTTTPPPATGDTGSDDAGAMPAEGGTDEKKEKPAEGDAGEKEEKGTEEAPAVGGVEEPGAEKPAE